jgi:osmotically-inducible protein OsmY
MQLDADIKQEAEQALRLDHQLDSSDIAVAVNHGVVLLTGFARSDEEKWQAARDVAHVAGVAGVANDIEVRLPAPGQASGPELARQSAEEIRRELPYSHRFVRLLLRNGWLTLEGEVEWNYQKDRAERAARRVTSLTGVSNDLRISRRVEPAELKRRLEEAFRRCARAASS